MKFVDLTEKGQVEDIVKISGETPLGALIFKHSTRCPISSMAYQRFLRNWKMDQARLPVFYLDLIRYRQVSDEVSQRFQVGHESPQVLLIRNGECVYHASHNAISPAAIEEEVADV